MRNFFKKRFPECALVVLSSLLWVICFYFTKNHFRFWEHNPYDIHTVQAMAWLQGKITIPNDAWNEVSFYKGSYFNSFPPVPSLLEIPWVIFFGRASPNILSCFLFIIAALVFLNNFAEKMSGSKPLAFILALTFIFGTNVLVLILQGGVWPQGQIYGFCFAIFGLRFLLSRQKSQRALSYFCLSLAVGCRPFYFFMLPAFFVFENYLHKIEKFWPQVFRGLLAFAPIIIILSTYNYIRFGIPWEFGHRYLPLEQKLIRGSFSASYFKENLFYAVKHLPTWQKNNFILNFDSFGTAFWINNFVVIVGLSTLFKRSVVLYLRVTLAAVVTITWLALLCHHSNGWMQFGYRYVVDLLPLIFLLCVLKLRTLRLSVVLLFLISFGVNVYGSYWFFNRPAEGYPNVLLSRYKL